MAFFRLFAGTALGSFAAIWCWVWAMPLAYMDPEYASWHAKQVMLSRCDLGSVVILGDSRAAAGILPNRLPAPAINLAVGGGEPVEAFAAAQRSLACPDRPDRAVISFDPSHFTDPDLLWERSVRYRFLSAADIARLREASRRTGDYSVYLGHNNGALPPRLRDLLYEAAFPPFSFSSLLHSAGFLRWRGNQRALRATIDARGQYYFGTEHGSHTVTAEGHLDAFRPLPILDHYFDRLLAMLDQHGIDTWFVAMPMNEATWTVMRPAVKQQFAAYLAGYERRYPHFHVVGDLLPHWPDRFFGDGFAHPTVEAAERVTAELAQRLQAAPPSTQKEAQNGWFSDTAPEASSSVAPSSKRGS